MRYARVLQHVDEVARTGSIRQAAVRLGMTSSALSRQVLDLEKDLGVVLFERMPRGVRLTVAGEILIAHIRRMLSDLEHTRSMFDDLKGLRRGTVHIASIEALASMILPQAIASFSGIHERIDFKVDILERDDVVSSVTNYIADIGVVFNTKKTAHFHHVMEIEQSLFATVAVGHPLAKRSGVKLRDCIVYPLAVASQSLGARALLNEFLDADALTLSPVLETNSFELMRGFVRASGGVCFQIAAGVEKRSLSENLVAIPMLDLGIPRRKLIVGVVAGRSLPLAAAMFCEHLVEILKGL
jgi:DNA-binding transcriptional LysR family regulator